MVVRFFCVIRVPVRRSHCAPCRLRVRPCVHGVCVPCACPGSPPCPCPCLFTVGTKKGKKNRGEPGHTGDGTHTHGTRGRTRAHGRITPTMRRTSPLEPHNHPNSPTHTRTSARRPKPRPTQQPQARIRPLPAFYRYRYGSDTKKASRTGCACACAAARRFRGRAGFDNATAQHRRAPRGGGTTSAGASRALLAAVARLGDRAAGCELLFVCCSPGAQI